LKRQGPERELRILRKAASYYPGVLALKMGLLKGHADYTKYILLGAARTGSNLLRSLLNSHSRIVAFGELFRDRDRIGWDLPGYFQNKKSRWMFQHDPVGFLRNEVFGDYPKRISAVGFKLFFHHAQSTDRRVIWPFLRDQTDLKIIHLKRRNLLRTYLSLQRATRTQQWVSRSKTPVDHLPILLDDSRCLRAFQEMRASEQELDKYFEDSWKLDVVYEDLSGDYTQEMRRVLDFLDVAHETVMPSVYKQSRQSLSSEILNYAEMKERFQNTPWEEFFED
jgi:LPS sulfotransferase NodH